MGFAEEQWLDQTTLEVDTKQLVYKDYNQVLRETSKILKEEYKCDLIISINHMRSPEDEDMAESNQSPEVLDMIFGGHDHNYYRKLNPQSDVFLQKSGTDFECFTNLTVLFGVEKQDYLDFES